MKKKLVALFIMLCLCITGCTVEVTSKEIVEEKQEEFQFERVYGSTSISVYVDTETKVMYAAYHGANCGGLTVMVDKDGKPRLWEGEEHE